MQAFSYGEKNSRVTVTATNVLYLWLPLGRQSKNKKTQKIFSKNAKQFLTPSDKDSVRKFKRI